MPTDTSKNLKAVIGQRLREARLLAGYKTIAEFARAYNMPKSTYNQYETGARALTIELLLYFAEIFNTNILWLITGEGSAVDTQAEILAKINVPCPMPLTTEQFTALIKESLKEDAPPPLPYDEEDAPVGMNQTAFVQVLEKVIKIYSRHEEQLDFNRVSNMTIDIYHSVTRNCENDETMQHAIDCALQTLDKALYRRSQMANGTYKPLHTEETLEEEV